MSKSTADHITHDLPEGEIILPVQRMFPNCEKYTRCCTKDKEFWETLQKRVEEFKPKKTYFRIEQIIPTKIKVHTFDPSDNLKLIRNKK